MWRWFTNNHQTLTGIGAMLVGIAALFVAWDQGRVMRAQQHGAVYPILQIDGYFSYEDDVVRLGAGVRNAGVGPAVIERVDVLRHGEIVEDFGPLLATLPESANVNWSSMLGRVLAAGDDVRPIDFNWRPAAMDDAGRDRLLAEWATWGLRACYCSVFDRCYVVDTNDRAGRPEPVRQCVRPTTEIFEQLGNAVPGMASPEES
ncbi:hypothetical protein [Maricaulis sp.]|uniref:hypothetical protein n=1 Tax=Maricaulis sp. TaxID=1486257 RepID=UPI003A9517AE